MVFEFSEKSLNKDSPRKKDIKKANVATSFKLN